jgi:uncharacterized membrane protein
VTAAPAARAAIFGSLLGLLLWAAIIGMVWLVVDAV